MAKEKVTEKKNNKVVKNTKKVEPVKAAKKVEVKKEEKTIVKAEKAEKKPNAFLTWLKTYKMVIGFFCLGLAIGIVIMAILWPDRIAELKDGTQVIASIDGKEFTADELYEDLKSSNGLTTVLSSIDDVILKEKYADNSEDADSYATEQSEYYYSMYEQMYGYTKDEFLSSNGFTEETFLDYWRSEYYYSKYYEDYLASLISEDEIEDEYNSNYFADKKVEIFYSSDDDDTDALGEIRKLLKKGTSTEDIQDKYSDISYADLGTVTYADSSSYTDDFISHLKDMTAGSYSKVFDDDNYGKVVIYVSEVSEAKSLEDAKDDVVSVLSDEKDAADENLYYKAVFALRESYNLKFFDTELADAYKTFKAKHE